jgi:peptide/nickel transport system substrate-binding protein
MKIRTYNKFKKQKKIKYVAILICLVMIFSFSNFNQPNELKNEEKNPSLSEEEQVLYFGTGSEMIELDPHNIWDSASLNVVSQIVEGLFEHDLSDPDLAIVPNLAAAHGTWNGNKYTVNLVPNVYFQDGTPFNAQAVEFSFNRLAYMMDNGYAVAADLYRYYDVETDQMKPIINSVEALSQYVVEFELDVPYAPFESLLCFIGSSILNPITTPPLDLIDVNSGTLIGTGPFVFEYFDPGNEVSLRAYENYRYGKADIDHLVFKYYGDATERAEALLNNKIHMMQGVPNDYIDIFETDPNFVVDSKVATTVYYSGMNNYWINKDVREAISYAIDYEYIIDVMFEGQVSRLRSPIPNGILYADDSFNVPEIDITYARTLMQNMGYGIGLDLYDDAGWEASTFLSYNFSYIIGNLNSENTYYLFQNTLAKIGIEVTDAGISGPELLARLTESPGFHREMLQLFWFGWGADYNDPSNFINNLFTNRTIASNGVNYNGYLAAYEAGRDPFNLWDNVQLLMEAALFETDVIIRDQYYHRIQQLLVEEDRPWVFEFSPIASIAYKSEIQGFQWNAMQILKFYGVTGVQYEVPPTIIVLGTPNDIDNIDPLDVWDTGSWDVIDQVAEGLFWYDFSAPDNAIIPKLAASHGTWDGNLYTVQLREGVEFHDGTPFNASAVEFWFDRLQYFIDNGMGMTAEFYQYYDPETDQMKPIINDVEILSEYSVRFHLDIPYGLFETLLAFESSFIVSPESTPLENIIDKNTDTLVGTGPFMYEYYDSGVEVSFRAFENYWDGEPSIDYLKFKIIQDEDERGDLLASGDIHMILNPPKYRRGEFEGNPDYTLDSIGSSFIQYLAMNNHWISRDLREAISYAIDYNYLINEIAGGEAIRSKSPIPNGILYADDSFNVAVTDIIFARSLMQNMGYGIGLELDDDAAWESSNFLSINYTYNFGSSIREPIYPILANDLGKIGIEVIDDGVEWGEFLNRLFINRDMYQLVWMSWGADYNDPSNYINNHFTNRTGAFNLACYNGWEAAIEAGRDPFYLWDNVQLLMEAALFETDVIIREQYYYRIQQLLVEEDMPLAYGYVPIHEVWYNSEIHGFQWNTLGKLNFFGVTGVPYEEPVPEPSTELLFGTYQDLISLDPLNVWDTGSWDVIDQVAEGLFWYDFSAPDNAIIPMLAADHGTWDGNTYTLQLRQNVEFHDGTRFNASAVEFWFDRLQYFMDNDMLMTRELYEYYDPETDQMKPIINNVEILSEYSVRFHLDIPYALFETLLAFESSFILSPESTPLENIIDKNTDTLVGTGPFMYEYYDPNVEVSFRAFENYWDGEPSIDHLVFKIVENAELGTNMLSAGELHMMKNPLTSLRYLFEGNPDYILYSTDSSVISFLGMNNNWINRDLREAISYAFDYDYVRSIYQDGDNTRLRSPIPNGILYADDSYNVAVTDIIFARSLMQSMGYGIGLDLYDDAGWEASTFLSINYTYNIGSQIREQLFYNLQESLGKIGIEVIDDGVDIIEFIYRLYEVGGRDRDMLQLFWYGWVADYNDPSNYINNLFTNRSVAYNAVDYNGWEAAIEAGRDPFNLWDNVQLLMEAAITETDPLIRESYYNRIQQLLVEEDMPLVYGYVGKIHVWYLSSIEGFHINTLGKICFHGVTGVFVDITPPVTEVTLEGTMGDNNWYVSDVLVTLEATDDESGVQMIGYSFDGVEWFLYTEPFFLEESKTLFYGAVDYAGNYEEPNSVEVHIDKDPPEMQVYEEGIQNFNFEFFDVATIVIDAWDGDSGVFEIYYSFDNIEWHQCAGQFDITALGTTDYYFKSIDYAGNEAPIQSGSVTITTRSISDPIVIYGLGYDPYEIDPLRAIDTNAYAVIDQVAEGLFAYDLSHPNMEIITRLAAQFGSWSIDGLTYTVDLVTNAVFHDGTPFTAEAVKFTFDRILYFLDSGNMYNDFVYRFTDGTPIISSVEILGTYRVAFHLNRPFAAFESLLCYTGSAILSPISTPPNEIMEPNTHNLIGTGPFELNTYVQDFGIIFNSYDNYREGEAPIDELWFLFIEDMAERTQALYDGHIDFLEDPTYDMLYLFEGNPDFTILNKPSGLVNFLSMNNLKINTVFRQAISYAFDYDFIISLYDDAIRAESIIAEGLLYSDWSSNHPILDIITARQILLDNGIVFGLDPHEDSDWTNLVDSGTPIATFKFDYNTDNMIRVEMYQMLRDNLRLIGIELVDGGVTWSEFVELLLVYPENLELFYLGWIPDINDPYSMLNPLLSNDGYWNLGFVDDPYLQSLMDQGIIELDPALRQSIYSELQRYFMEELVPLLPILDPMLYFVQNSRFPEFPLNALSKVWFYSIISDVIPPMWQPYPTDQIIELGDHLSYQISATDSSGIDHYWVGDTENFAVDSNGLITTNILLEVGVYELEIRAYDPYDNYCSAIIQVIVMDTTAPEILPLYDTIPSETIIIYTRSTQVIGSLLAMDFSEIGPVVLEHNDPPGGPNGFIVETYPQPEIYVHHFNNIVIKTTSSLELGKHNLSLYIYDNYGNYAQKDFVVLVYRQFDLKLTGELDYLEKEKVRISLSAYLSDPETGEYINPADYAGLNLVVGFDLYDPDGNYVKGGYLTYEDLGVWRWVDQDTINSQKNILKKGVYMIEGWVDVDHDYILKNRDVIQIHIDPPADEGVDPITILIIISFSGLIAIITLQILLYFRKIKQRK